MAHAGIQPGGQNWPASGAVDVLTKEHNCGLEQLFLRVIGYEPKLKTN